MNFYILHKKAISMHYELNEDNTILVIDSLGYIIAKRQKNKKWIEYIKPKKDQLEFTTYRLKLTKYYNPDNPEELSETPRVGFCRIWEDQVHPEEEEQGLVSKTVEKLAEMVNVSSRPVKRYRSPVKIKDIQEIESLEEIR